MYDLNTMLLEQASYRRRQEPLQDSTQTFIRLATLQVNAGTFPQPPAPTAAGGSVRRTLYAVVCKLWPFARQAVGQP